MLYQITVAFLKCWEMVYTLCESVSNEISFCFTAIVVVFY